MKKCRFCSHRGVTDKGEEVCTKYLLYVGDDNEEIRCNDFEVSFNYRPMLIIAIIMITVLNVILSIL